jgi:hypothetical protein
MFSITEIFGDDKVAHDLTLFSPEHVEEVEKRLFAKGKQRRPYIKCYASEKDRPAKPEEIVRQLWLIRLMRDFGYGRSRLRVEEGIHIGRQVKRADIVVLDEDKADTPYIIVELKKTKLTDGKDQLKSYTKATGAPIGVWSNGSLVSIYHREDPNYFSELPRLPRASETVDDVVSEEVALAYLDGKHHVAEDLLPRLFEGGAHYFDIDALRALIEREGLSYEPATIRRYLHQWSREGRLHDAGRGWYSDLPDSVELDTSGLRALVDAITEEFPFLDFAVWSTRQLSPWFHHLLNRHLTFVKVERETIQAVGEALESASHDVLVHPLGKDARNFRTKSDETIIIRPLHADETPGEDHTLPTEHILVDLRVEIERLGFVDSGEYELLLRNLGSQFRLQLSELRRHAKRPKIGDSALLSALPVNVCHFSQKNDKR